MSTIDYFSIIDIGIVSIIYEYLPILHKILLSRCIAKICRNPNLFPQSERNLYRSLRESDIINKAVECGGVCAGMFIVYYLHGIENRTVNVLFDVNDCGKACYYQGDNCGRCKYIEFRVFCKTKLKSQYSIRRHLNAEGLIIGHVDGYTRGDWEVRVMICNLPDFYADRPEYDKILFNGVLSMDRTLMTKVIRLVM